MNNSKSIEVELPTGEVIWARATVDGPRNVAAHPFHHLDMEDFRRTVKGVSATLRQAVGDLAPDETQVEFGLELEVKAGKLVSVLAEAGATATVKVALTWKREAEPAAAPGRIAVASE
ncbi:CU044_2847 family protein [Kribbella sp. NPDC050124]|uniref:CU044_2847 family protein n=1 Tax=Kribbella sp. NPDC050124 TaxID=3364114 RepID=UPI0037B568FA